MSRPTKFSDALADRICELLLEGKSLVAICDLESMPSRSTVMRWMQADPDFATKCARAREMQADLMDDMILEVANKSTTDTAPADRVKIAAYQWRASKLQPKKYGDKIDVNHSGSIQTMSEEQVDARLAELLGKTGAGAASGAQGADQSDK